MEINYATIIDYLNPESNIGNTIHGIESTQSDSIKTKNIISNLDFLDSSIFKILQKDNKFHKLGVTNKMNFDNNIINVSFFSSILSLIDENYVVLDEHEEKSYIRNFITKIKEEIVKSSFKFELKYKFPKTVLMDRILDLKFEDTIIYQVIVQILDINLIIFSDLNKNEKGFKTLFPEFTMNPWKPTLLMFKNGNSFEPIMSERKKLFSFSDSFIKELFTTNFSSIEYLNSKFLDKEFSINDDFNQTLDEFILESNSIIDESKMNNEKVNKITVDKNTEYEEDSDDNDLTKDVNKSDSIGESNAKHSNHKKSILKNKKLVDEHITKELNSIENKKKLIEKDNIDSVGILKTYKKTELDKLKKEYIIELVKNNPQLLSKFNKINKNILKKDLIDKFIFYQNLLKNQNSIQSGTS